MAHAMRNYMEDVVEHTLKLILPNLDVCKCEICQMDMMAYALNHLPPKYVVTPEGELYSKLAELVQQSEVDAEVALIEAAKVVSKNPRHNRKKG
ncbi:MAG: competence protein ComFB [Clostridiales bacterium]|nr:competence protein ComFB [Clostridiales bacterium]MDK2902805.1 competence protein ComFB [Clostridiales bacterium]MDK2992745.1 competence protein ComFB [Clostridiales bacterium]